MSGMLHIIQNDPEVPPGNLIDHLTVPYMVHYPYRDGLLPEPGQVGALIVMGGSMGANDDDKHPFLVELKGLIHTVVAAEIPYLRFLPSGGVLRYESTVVGQFFTVS